MNSKIAIGIFAILMCAAFAGVAVAGDDANAGSQVLQYTVGTTVYSETVDTDTVTLKDLEALGCTIPEGKTFKGWASADPKQTTPTTIYSAGSTYALSTGKVLWAVIEDVTYKVTFSYADGTSILSKESLTYDSTLTLPATATSVAAGKVLKFDESAGMIFIGWALADDLETIVIDDAEKTVKVLGDADYVAIYAHDPILTFIVDGTQIYSHTEYGAVLPTAPSKEGFAFVGWSDGEIIVADADLATYVSLLLTDVTLTAVWEPAVYEVVFVVDGETVLTQSVKHGETATEPMLVPTKDGSSFTAWTVDGKAFDFSTPVVSDLTVVAAWESVYTVSFVVDGETVLTQSVKDGRTATEPEIVPAKDGYSFVAWTVDGKIYDFGSAVTGDLTLTADFKALPAPAPTGLKDPMTQMLLIIIGTLVLALIAVMLWKRDVIRAGLVKRLDKGDKGNGGDSA